MQETSAPVLSGTVRFDPLTAALDLPFVERPQALAQSLGVAAQDVLAMYAQSFGMQAMGGDQLQACQADFDRLSFAECQRRRCVLAWLPRGQQERLRVLVTCDPLRFDHHQMVEALVAKEQPKELIRVLTLKADFESYLAAAEQGLRAMDSVPLGEGNTLEGLDPSSVLKLSLSNIENTDNATVRLVDSTLYDALKVGASDIHFETQGKALHIKYRLDGVLQSIKRVESTDTASQVISRIKVLSDLDISERRIPQDGRFRVLLDSREIDFRVSVMPNITGEDAVLRILDRKHLTGQFQSLSLDTLSFEQPVKDFIRQAAKLPYGLLLVTGPTGSGKTTTLYAALSEINTGLDKIVTIEDPIEYQLSGVLQIPVNEKKGLTFAKGLRSILRHDPDKIMVGEIRDSETAQIAVQAALTGHQVFTTVHANNVFDVIGRFSNMGVDSYSLVAALTGIMAQRLVRAVCLQCAREATLTHTQDAEIEASMQRMEPGFRPRWLQAVGCPSCRATGYRGRKAIAETLYLDDAMKDLLVQQAPISTIKTAAKARGFLSLRDSAVLLAMRGMTTLDEINRVTPIQ